MGYIELNEADIVTTGGAEVTIAAMDEYSRAEIGRKTLCFVRRVMQDPVMKARIRARAAEIRANGEYGGKYGNSFQSSSGDAVQPYQWRGDLQSVGSS